MTATATVSTWLRGHHACPPGYAWAVENCTTMQEVWDRCPRPDWLVWLAARPGVLPVEQVRRFALFCAEQAQAYSDDPRVAECNQTTRRFLDGMATREELEKARAAARAAEWAAARAAEWAARDAARDAEWAAEWAAKAAEWATEWAARAAECAAGAAECAAGAAEWATARAAEAEWLRTNTTPKF